MQAGEMPLLEPNMLTTQMDILIRSDLNILHITAIPMSTPLIEEEEK